MLILLTLKKAPKSVLFNDLHFTEDQTMVNKSFSKLDKVGPYSKSILPIAKTLIFNQHTRGRERTILLRLTCKINFTCDVE